MSLHDLLFPWERRETGDVVLWKRWLLPNMQTPRQQLDNLLKGDGKTVANYQPGGYTGTLNASAWANAIGSAPSLAQGTGANQPIIVSADYVKKAYLPGATGNKFTTPSAAALDITSVLDFQIRVAADNWIPSGYQAFFSRNTLEIDLQTGGTGKVIVFWNDGGNASRQLVTSVATGLTNGAFSWLRFLLDASGANTTFKVFTSPDGSSPGAWTQLGTTSTAAGVTGITNSASALQIGGQPSSDALAGKVIRALMYNGDSTAGGVLKMDFNASDWPETSTNTTTQASSTTGEVWTLNNTGTNLAQIAASPQLLTVPASSHFMQAAITGVTDFTLYSVINPITWINNAALFNAKNGASVGVIQATGTPKTHWLATGAGTDNSNGTLNAWHVLTATRSGNTFTLAYDGNAAVSDTLTGANLDRYTIGTIDAASGQFSNTQRKEDILRSGLDSAATQARIQALLKAIHSTP